MTMDCVKSEYVLIRDGNILVRVDWESDADSESSGHEFFDVRSGVLLREIHPPLAEGELERGVPLPDDFAASIMNSGLYSTLDPNADATKVVSILEVRQRKLDSVVADSILGQLRVIKEVIQDFLNVAENAPKEERFWLSQQVLTLLRKFSGRELAELEEITEWFKKRPQK